MANSTTQLKLDSVLSLEDQMTLIEANPSNISLLRSPHRDVQLKSVKEDGNNIRYIENPLEEIQLEAVRKRPAAIIAIMHPTEKVQKFIYINYPGYVKFINNHSRIIINIVDSRKKLFPENFICSICLDGGKFEDTLRLKNCDHWFHKKCIREWFRQRETCPMCRTKKDPSDVIPQE